MNDLKTPCDRCNHSWSIKNGSNCTICCKEYEIYQKAIKMKVSFCEKLDKAYINFSDYFIKRHGKQYGRAEEVVLRKFIEYIKNIYKMEDS